MDAAGGWFCGRPQARGTVIRRRRAQITAKTGEEKLPETGWLRPPEATRPNEIWAMDFIFEKTKQGGQLKFLTVLDEGGRECLEIRTETRMTGRDVLKTLDELMQEHGKPKYV
jgi:putative transposase